MIRILAVCRIFDHILNQISSCVILIDIFFSRYMVSAPTSSDFGILTIAPVVTSFM